MRNRAHLMAGVALAAGLVLGMAASAHAATEAPTVQPLTQEQFNGIGHENQIGYECLAEQTAAVQAAYQESDPTKRAAALDKVDFNECAEAPSPLLPATNEIIWGGIAFLITLLALWKFAYPGMKKGMEGRSERIRADLQAAEDARVEAEQLKAEYEQRLAAAKQEATRVIEDARGTADALKAELQQRAEAEIGEMRQRAAADVEAMKGQALADLQHEVAQIAIGAAEVVVEKNLDEATQRQLVENYINTVASRN